MRCMHLLLKYNIKNKMFLEFVNHLIKELVGDKIGHALINYRGEFYGYSILDQDYPGDSLRKITKENSG